MYFKNVNFASSTYRERADFGGSTFNRDTDDARSRRAGHQRRGQADRHRTTVTGKNRRSGLDRAGRLCARRAVAPASQFVSVNDREVKKVPLLRGKSVFNLFFENSTRTRTTFDIAATRLSANVYTLDIARSSRPG